MPTQEKKKQLGKPHRRIRPSMLMQIEETSTEISGRSTRSNDSAMSGDTIYFDSLDSEIQHEEKETSAASTFVKNPDVFASTKSRNSSLIRSGKEFSIDFPMNSSATSMQNAKEFSIDFPISGSTTNKRDSLALHQAGSDSSLSLQQASNHSRTSNHSHHSHTSNHSHHSRSPNNSSSSLDIHSASLTSSALSGSMLESSLNLRDISERDEDVSDELVLSSKQRSFSLTAHGSNSDLTDIKNIQRQNQSKRHSTLTTFNSFLNNSDSSMGSHINQNPKERFTDSSTLKSIRNRRLGGRHSILRPSIMRSGTASRPHSSRASHASGGSHVTFSESDRHEQFHPERSHDPSMIEQGRHFDSIEEDIDASEQFFSDPKEPRRHSHFNSDETEQIFSESESNGQRHVNFRQIRQGKQSMLMELNEVERYLATLRQSVVDTRSSLTGDSLIKPDRDRSERPGILKDSTNNSAAPKSRRRFSMAYRSTEEVVTFPDDCFSFLILHGPKESPLFFWFAVFISILQLGFLFLALLSMIHPDWTAIGYTDNPQKLFFFFPSSVTGLMRCTQLFAIVSYCIFADMSVKDYLTAIELFPQYSKLQKGDKYWCMVFSCVLRFLMGILTVIVTVIMLLTNDNVIDTILDFLAMNFIGDIGKMAFQLCLWGKYGWRLEEEARRIEDMELPRCMLRKTSQRRYLISVIPILVFAFGLMGFLFTAQIDNRFWTTQTLKIQFYDNSPLEPYSGCYKRDSSRPWWFNNNRVNFDYQTNDHTLPGLENTTMGYCQDTKKWILFDSNVNDINACDIATENKLLQSSSTSAYDIKDILGSTWSDRYGNAVAVSFVSDGAVNTTTCEIGIFPHNGRCDRDLNDFDNNYDGGDCCGSTCMGLNCGVGGLNGMTLFGTNISYGDGFPLCEDPSMKPITIYIESIYTIWDGDLDQTDVIEPKMMLDCDDKNVFTVNVNENMSGNKHTFNVMDGAECTIRITNSTSSTESMQQPIFYVNYTVYHGDLHETANDMIEIAREQSFNNQFLRFQRQPDCYFEKLSDYIDNSTIYTKLGVEERAVRWLLYGSRYSSNFYCEDDFFLERYALSAINFAAPEKRLGVDYYTFLQNFFSYTAAEQEQVFYEVTDEYLWLEDTRQCIWSAVECNKRSVEVLDLHNIGLTGPIASSIGMLSSLKKLDLSNNNFNEIIPTEIGKLAYLEDLDLANNDLTGTIPIEMGLLRNLTILDLANNNLTGTIPTQIGLLKNLTTLDLSGNNLLGGTIPTELGALKNLTEIVLSNHQEGLVVITEDPELRGKVFVECSVENCTPLDNSCSKWRDEHEHNQMQMQIDVCAHFLRECYICQPQPQPQQTPP